MFFTFPEDARGNAEQQAVSSGVEIGEYRGVGPGPTAGGFSGFCPSGPPPSGASRCR